MASQTRDVRINFDPYMGEGATQFSRQMGRLVKKGLEAQEAMNIEAVRAVEQEIMRLKGLKGEAEVKVDVKIVDDSRGGFKRLERVAAASLDEITKNFAKGSKYAQGFNGEMKRSMDGAQAEVEQLNAALQEQMDILDKLAVKAAKRASITGMRAERGKAAPHRFTREGRRDGGEAAGAMQMIEALNQQMEMTEKKQLQIIKQFARFGPPESVNKMISELEQRIGSMGKGVKMSKGEFLKLGKAAGSIGSKFQVGDIIGGLKEMGATAQTAFNQFVNGGIKGNKNVGMLKKQVMALKSGGTVIGRLSMAFKGMGAAVSAAFGPISALIAVFGALSGAVYALMGRQKQLQGLKLTMDGVGVSAENQNAVLLKSRNIALSYGISLAKVEGAYKRLGPAILESGGDLNQVTTAIEGISARTTMLGLSAEQSGRYIEAFAQVMGKGKLQSEELNQQFSELDGGLRGQIKNYLAAKKGITDFEGAMKRGEITSAIFLEAFEYINKEITEKFKQNIDDVVLSLDTLGKEGGMTLAQFQQKLSALNSITMENIGKALAPLGRELGKIVAAFVQFFTKISSEMPGITALWQGLGKVIGGSLKFAILGMINLWYRVAQILDSVIQASIKFYKILRQIPVIGKVLQATEIAFESLGKEMDKTTDKNLALSDATKGANVEFTDEQQRLQEVKQEMERLTKTTGDATPKFKRLAEEAEELSSKLDMKQKRQVDDAIKEAKDKAQAALDQKKEEIKAQEEAVAEMERIQGIMSDALKKRIEDEKKVVEDAIEATEEERDEKKKAYDDMIEDVQDKAEATKEAIKDEKDAIKSAAKQTDRNFKQEITKVTERYDSELEGISEAKDAAKAAHEAQMKSYDNQIARIDALTDARLAGIEKQRDAINAQADAAIAAIERQKEAVEDAAERQLELIEQQKKAAEGVFDREKARIEGAKNTLTNYYDSMFAQMDKERANIDRNAERELNGISRAKEASKTRHDSRIRELDAELRKIQEASDKVQERINKEKEASQQATDLKIAGLEELTPAEKILKQMEISKLRITAQSKLATAEERLQAQAQLERMERDQQIAALREAEKIRQAKLEEKARKDAEERQRKEEAIATRKQELAVQEEARQQRMDEAEKMIQQRREASLERVDNLQKEMEQRRDASMKELQAAEEAAERRRDAALDALNTKEENIQERRETDLENLEGQEETIDTNRNKRLDDLDKKEAGINENREQRIQDIEDKQVQAKEDHEERLNDLEDKEKEIQGDKEERLRELERAKDDAKEAADKRLEALEKESKRVDKDMKDRVDDLKDAQETMMEDYEDAIKDQKDELKRMDAEIQNIDDAVDDSVKTTNDLTVAMGATYDQLVNNRKELRNMWDQLEANRRKAKELQDTVAGKEGVSVSSNIEEAGTLDKVETPTATSDLGVGTPGERHVADIDEGLVGIDNAEIDVNNLEIPGLGDRIGDALEELAMGALTMGLSGGPTEAADRLMGRASGGPVNMGQKYTVNEIGREGFMNAVTGKMKEIKAPKYGTWRAPAKGTVIPAHIWKDLKKSNQTRWQDSRIKSDMGVDMGVATSSPHGGSVDGVSRSISAAMAAMAGGDSFNNNITIQSNNPTKSAGDMMVAMARMRHRR